jgi:hypothetical protein
LHFVLSIQVVSQGPMSFPYPREVAATVSACQASEQAKLPGDCQFGKNRIERSSQIVLLEGQSLCNDSGTNAMSQHPNYLALDCGKVEIRQRSMGMQRRPAASFSL